jgi:hypothetical protein
MTRSSTSRVIVRCIVVVGILLTLLLAGGAPGDITHPQGVVMLGVL